MYKQSFVSIPKDKVIQLCESLINRTELSNTRKKAAYISKYKDKLNSRQSSWWRKLFCLNQEPYTLETTEERIKSEIVKYSWRSDHLYSDYFASDGTTWSGIAKHIKQLAEASAGDVMITAEDWSVIAKG